MLTVMRRLSVHMNEYRKLIIWQTTITLPHFHYEMPVLYLADGASYIPVRALCAMLGLRLIEHCTCVTPRSRVHP